MIQYIFQHKSNAVRKQLVIMELFPFHFSKHIQCTWVQIYIYF